MALTCIKTTLAMALCALAAILPGGAGAQSAGDSDILAAKEAAQKAQWKALETLRVRLAGHPLEAYPAYWLLVGAIDRANPAEVQAFIARYKEGPLVETLRRDPVPAPLLNPFSGEASMRSTVSPKIEKSE